MNRTRLNEILRRLPLLAALTLSLLALSAVGLAAFLLPHNGLPVYASAFGNFFAVARTYVFRNSVTNSALVMAVVSVSLYSLVRTVSPRLAPLGRRRAWLAALAITPLFLPVPYAALLWRPIADRLDATVQPGLAILVIAAIQVWRLWPLAIVASPLLSALSTRRVALAVALAAAYLVLMDVGTPLIVTGGEPYNESHLWATWTFHAIWVSRHWGHGAVMLGGLAFVAGLLGGLIWIIMRRTQPTTGEERICPSPAISSAALLASAAIAVLPLAWNLPSLFGHGLAAVLEQMLRTGYVRWSAYTALILASSVLIGLAILLPARNSGLARRAFPSAACLVVGFAVVPVWYWLAMRGYLAGTWMPGLLAATTGMSAGMVAFWLVNDVLHKVNSGGQQMGKALCTVAIVAALLLASEFALAVAVSGVGAATTLGAGAALQLAGIWPTPLAATASVVTFMLTFAVVAAAMHAMRRETVPSPYLHQS